MSPYSPGWTGVFYDAGFLVYNTGCRDGDAGKGDLLLLLTDDAAEAVDDARTAFGGRRDEVSLLEASFLIDETDLMAVPPTSKQL